MLDYKFIKNNIDAVEKNIKNRNMNVDAKKVVKLFDKKNALTISLQEWQTKRNENAVRMKGTIDAEERKKLIENGKEIKKKVGELEKLLEEAIAALEEEAKKIPNMSHPAAPIGKMDSENLEVKKCGKIPSFSFPVKDHVELMEGLDLLDFERATKVSGQKFYYLKNEAVFLEQALIMFALNTLKKHGFKLFITPDVAKEEILSGIGFNPRGNESNVYTISDEGTCLVATAEITLGGYHSGEILEKDALPLFYGGLSHCFRREAGAAGQFSRGLYRVHQFDKVEMFSYALPEESDKIHEKLREIEEEIFTTLGIPFRVVDTCTGDLGSPAYRKWDIEAWMPGRREWGEVTSTSNCTDYQARRLGIRYRDADGKNKFVHTLNGTALAVGRAMIAIVENNQQADGSIVIPEVLVPLCGFDVIKK